MTDQLSSDLASLRINRDVPTPPSPVRRAVVPVLVIGNSADDACTPSHTQRLFDCVSQTAPSLHIVKGATHYYAGQPDKLAEATGVVTGWLERHGFAGLPVLHAADRS